MTHNPPELANGAARPVAGRGRDYLVRSEERLAVSTRRVLSGYARLEKFVVTETKTITVEVSHEEFRLVHDLTPEAGPAVRDPDPTEPQHPDRWLYLSREEVVVTKTVVPGERIRLEVYPVTEQRQVTENVRTEQIDTIDVRPDSGPPA